MPHFERIHEYPAFPVPVVYGGVTMDVKWGLTLIDWFATHAMAAILPVNTNAMDTEPERAALARLAYQMANDMLDERALWVKGPPMAGTLNIT